MGGLSQDLNSYLNKSNGSSSSLSSLTSKLGSMKLPTLKTPFGSGGGEDDEEPFLGVTSDKGISGNNRKDEKSWLARKLEENLPSLSKKQRIIGFMTSLILGWRQNCQNLPNNE